MLCTTSQHTIQSVSPERQVISKLINFNSLYQQQFHIIKVHCENLELYFTISIYGVHIVVVLEVSLQPYSVLETIMANANEVMEN